MVMEIYFAFNAAAKQKKTLTKVATLRTEK